MLKNYMVEIVSACFFLGVATGVLGYVKIYSFFSNNVNHLDLFPKSIFILTLIILTALLLIGGNWLFRRIIGFANMKFFIVAILFFIIGISLSLIHVYLKPLNADIYVGKKIIVDGIVSHETDVRETSVRLSITPNNIREFNGTQTNDTARHDTHSEEILVITDRYSDYKFGDRLEISGILKFPESIESEDGRIFDYKNYLEAKGIRYQMIRPSIKLISQNNFDSIIAKTQNLLFKIKRHFVNSLEEVLTEPHVSLAEGILLGEKRSLGKDLEDLFRRSGLIHIVVLSGYNVSIIAVVIIGILKSFLKGKSVILFGVLSLILFSLMVGGGATVIRSALMASVALFSESVNKKYDVLRALVLAGVFMVSLNPLILLYDPSFQLSFLATLGLILFSDDIKLLFLSRITEKFSIKETLSATFSAQILTSPLIIYMMGQFSIVSPITNILVLPIMPIAMLSVFVTGFVSLFSVFLATPLGWISYGILHYVLTIVDFFGSLSYSSIKIPTISIWLVFLSYIIIFLIKWKSSKYIKRKYLLRELEKNSLQSSANLS
ncbi:MAG: ComEC/Rec2 family competence protein [bacterium]|nr:ComEC/Rec2 family competence protein [bacterium]